MAFNAKNIDAATDSLFEKFDKDKSGYLDRYQLMDFIGSLYKKMGKPNPSAAQINSILKTYDKNYDGVLQK